MAVLDANVERIIVRVFGNSFPSRPSKTMLNQVTQRLLPLDNHREYNYGLLDLGRLVCRYTYPKCDVCPLNSICDYSSESSGENVGRQSTSPKGDTHSKLKIARQSRGMSLQQLAAFAGVSKLTIIRIESGKTSPRHGTLERLAMALKVEQDDLID